MELSSRKCADVLLVAPIGRLDHSNAQRLQEALAPLLLGDAESKKSALLFDFSGVEYISSMGLRILMVAAKAMRSQNARIAVAALQPVVAEIFDIARFKHVLEVFPSVRAALEQLSEPALVAYEARAR